MEVILNIALWKYSNDWNLIHIIIDTGINLVVA